MDVRFFPHNTHLEDPTSRILTKSLQSKEIFGIPAEPLPLALLRLNST